MLESVVDPEECMKVIGQRDGTADPDLVQALCPSRGRSLSSRLGTRRKRAWTVDLTLPRAPPSGMKRMLLGIAGDEDSKEHAHQRASWKWMERQGLCGSVSQKQVPFCRLSRSDRLASGQLCKAFHLVVALDQEPA